MRIYSRPILFNIHGYNRSAAEDTVTVVTDQSHWPDRCYHHPHRLPFFINPLADYFGMNTGRANRYWKTKSARIESIVREAAAV